MGSSNSKKEQPKDLYFTETAVSRISTQYQTERKIVETEDVFVPNLSQESTSTDNFSTFMLSTQNSNKDSIQGMLQIWRSVNDEFDSDGMDSDDSYDSELDEPKRSIRIKQPAVRFPKQNLNSSLRPGSNWLWAFVLVNDSLWKFLNCINSFAQELFSEQKFLSSSEVSAQNYFSSTTEQLSEHRGRPLPATKPIRRQAIRSQWATATIAIYYQ